MATAETELLRITRNASMHDVEGVTDMIPYVETGFWSETFASVTPPPSTRLDNADLPKPRSARDAPMN